MTIKGKTTFSTYEASEIKDLLVKIRNGHPDIQKDYRNKLRNKYQFYISDFTNSKRGFTPGDFDALVKLGQITINVLPVKIS